MARKSKIFKCAACGAEFESTATHIRWCPKCRLQAHREMSKNRNALHRLRETLRRERKTLAIDRERRLKARDAEYAKLGVPVTTRIAANGMVVETRGQVRIASSCGITPGMDSAIVRKYL